MRKTAKKRTIGAKKSTRRSSAKKVAPKRTMARKTTARKPASANPFKGADFIKQQTTQYKVQQVVTTGNGLSVKEKTVKRTPATDRKFNQLKKNCKRK